MSEEWNYDLKAVTKGRWLVALSTDEGHEIHTLEHDGKDFIYDGEPTYCQTCYFNPYAFKTIEPAPVYIDEVD